MLLEHEAQRFAQALDDYDHVSVADIGGSEDGGFWLVVHDHRFVSVTTSGRTATTGTL